MRRSGAQLRRGWPACAVAAVVTLVAAVAPELSTMPVGAVTDASLTDVGVAGGTWQAEAMRFDLLPGDPPGDGVEIATIERGGVDADHPSLAGAVRNGHHVDYWNLAVDEQPTAVSAQNGVSDPAAHATGVASLMVGQPSGAVPGIAPGATVYPINIGDGREDDMIRGIMWAVDAGVDVVNVSQVLGCSSILVFSSCPGDVREATDYAERNGVVVVAAAGNNGGGDGCTGKTDADQWPAVLDTVISVGAYEPGGEVWQCTPRRADVDVLAPGVRLLLADVGGEHSIGEGTSFAAPLVSGLIAVILAERPDLNPAEIRRSLPNWLGADGRLDVPAALAAAGVLEPGEREHVR
ncbi:S8 family peptidase [Phytoactinopolyspora halotolerans]|uniref:S8 family serine peptidase n=1 Tax=Phytoactinopolyspora halotolerans TaxID=1981512 RepID=A0A6L9SAJ9_9ACTN|nr:S8 family serine peptidase [Phytoactinopolyspora halotolerans]NEE02276.1 S8 family serine peptidase [Phytoactinopolyspora halotolerans]